MPAAALPASLSPLSPAAARAKTSLSVSVASSHAALSSPGDSGVHLAARPPVGSSGVHLDGANTPTVAPVVVKSGAGQQKLPARAAQRVAMRSHGVPSSPLTATQTGPSPGMPRRPSTPLTRRVSAPGGSGSEATRPATSAEARSVSRKKPKAQRSPRPGYSFSVHVDASESASSRRSPAVFARPIAAEP